MPSPYSIQAACYDAAAVAPSDEDRRRELRGCCFAGDFWCVEAFDGERLHTACKSGGAASSLDLQPAVGFCLLLLLCVFFARSTPSAVPPVVAAKHCTLETAGVGAPLAVRAVCF